MWRDRRHLFVIQCRTDSDWCTTSNSLIVQEPQYLTMADFTCSICYFWWQKCSSDTLWTSNIWCPCVDMPNKSCMILPVHLGPMSNSLSFLPQVDLYAHLIHSLNTLNYYSCTGQFHFFLRTLHVHYTCDATSYPQLPNSDNTSARYEDILGMTTSMDCINGVGRRKILERI